MRQRKRDLEQNGLTFALQALLHRHESYVKDSQAEHHRLSSYVQELESQRSSLQEANERFVSENKELLSQLQTLNADLAGSGKRVKDLEELLQECESEVRRLSGLARKAEELESKVLDMERERDELCRQIDDGKHENRSTIVRWKDSERRIRELEKEVQRIEWEATLDKQRHEEICARMEKERSLERELGLSEGRLKATAAVQSMKGNAPGGKAVVSNFVRDILQDNANLQAGIEELRLLLQSSNEEVENLREQVLLHQPVLEDNTVTPSRSTSLGDELASLSESLPKQVQQEVHVHHHYHAKLASKKERVAPVRRSSRRRAVMATSASASPGSSTPSTPLVRPQRMVSSPAVPMSLGQAQPIKNRWSVQSAATTSTYMSSMASSPRSYLDRNSSIFDRIERGEDSSRPTSPESAGFSSPVPWKKDRFDIPPLHSFQEEDGDQDEAVSPLESSTNNLNTSNQEHEVGVPVLTPKPSNIQAEQKEVEVSIPPPEEPRPPDPVLEQENSFQNMGVAKTDRSTEDAFEDSLPLRRTLHRASSHESLVSISGMDIHLAQRPSAASTLALLHGNSYHFANRPAQARKVSATQPLASVTEYTATSRPGLDSHQSASFAALSGIATNNIKQSPRAATPATGAMGRLGGWVRGKWGVAPTKSVADLRSAAFNVQSPPPPVFASPAASVPIQTPVTAHRRKDSATISTSMTDSQPPSTPVKTSMQPTLSRTPGINQPGFIPGLAALAVKKASTSTADVQTRVFDLDGLRESLAE